MNGLRSARYEAAFLNLLRIMSGFLFWQHGAQKVMGWVGGRGLGEGGLARLASAYGVGGILEFFGGIAIALGLFTRPVAFVLAGEMAVVYFWRHMLANGELWPIQNRGELAALYCFIYLYLFIRGGGDFSLDGLFRRRARPGEGGAGGDQPGS